MDAVQLKETLNNGGMVFGCMISAMGMTRFASALAGSTLDYVIIDSEHGSRGRAEIQGLCTMLRAANITPIVRVPIPKSEWVAMALDAGAAGVLVPYCETVEEVQAVVATAKWHPLKGEYLIRAVRDGVLPSEKSKAYLENRHRESVVIIGIESEPGYRNLDNILAVEGLDAIFIGPNDMTTSLGIPDEVTNQKYLDVIKDIIDKTAATGRPTMIHQQTVETSTTAIELGARFVLHSMDARLMQMAMQQQFAQLRAVGVEVHGAAAVPGAEAADTVETV